MPKISIELSNKTWQELYKPMLLDLREHGVSVTEVLKLQSGLAIIKPMH